MVKRVGCILQQRLSALRHSDTSRCCLLLVTCNPFHFQALDMFVLEFLGSTETSGPMTACFPGVDTKQGSVGKGYPQFETEILNGEIVTRGRNCCMGYLWEEDKTAELVDSEGWVHSGDLGRKDEDGFFYITGRIKEIIITAGGENIAPVPIEEKIKAELPVVRLIFFCLPTSIQGTISIYKCNYDSVI